MSTITLENVRACSDITMKVRLKDNGVAVDWSGLTDIKALVYSDDQKAVAGRCAVSVDSEDPTVLVCLYAATKPQYLGVNSIIVRAKYMGREKTYDKQAVNIVARTAELEGEQVVLEDPEVTVDIEVVEVDSSILDAAIAAAFDAADKANEAAEQIPLQVLTEAREATAAANTAAAAANAAGITSVQASIADNEPGTPSVDAALLNKALSLVFHHLKGEKGDTGATPNITVGAVTTGEPGTPVVVTMTGTAEAPVLNITIPQGAKGEQGNTGSSVDYPYELVNNLTTNDATKGLSAAQGVVLDGKVSQLEAEVNKETARINDYLGGNDLQLLTGWVRGYIVTNLLNIPNSDGSVTITENNNYSCLAIPCSPGDVFLLNNRGGSGSGQRSYAWAQSDFRVISYSPTGHACDHEFVTAPANAAWLVLNHNSRKEPPACYKGNSFKNYVDTLISVENTSEDTKTIQKAGINYVVSSDNVAKRLLQKIDVTSGTASIVEGESANVDIIPTTNVSLKKGSIIELTLTGLDDYVSNVVFYANGYSVAIVSTDTWIYQATEDVTSIRVLVRYQNIRASGDVSANVRLLGVYNALAEFGEKTKDSEELSLRKEMEDVFINHLITPEWHSGRLANNAAQEYADSAYITSGFIPVDNIAFLRVSANNVSFLVYRFDANKTRFANPDSYSGDTIIRFNARISQSFTKYIRIVAETSDPANIVLYCDTVASRFNNMRLLGNKNTLSFGHRGSSLRTSPYTAADNYPSSVWGAYINGFEGIHVNVQFTTDNVPYCLHDETFVDGVSGNTVTLVQSTSAQIDACTRNGQPIAKVESAIYMAKMMGLDVILYNIYGGYDEAKVDALISLVKKYDMFEHTYFGIDSGINSPMYLRKVATAFPQARILLTQEDISSSEYSQITAVTSRATTILQTRPELRVYLWLYGGHPEENFIQANMDKPYNVRLAAFGVTEEQYPSVLPYVSIYTSNIGRWSFGSHRRDIEKIVTDKYPEFLLGDYGNIV